MNCFYHSGSAAIGICKSCFRGVCEKCAAPGVEGVACASRCEEKVKVLMKFQERAATSFGIAAGSYARSAIFIALMGILFIGYGWEFNEFNQRMKIFFEVFGGLFILGGAFYAYTATKYKK